RVHGVDVNQRNVDAINAGSVPFVEPELGDFVKRNVEAGRMSASIETPAADAYIVAVPTPFMADKTPDLSYIDAAARTLAQQLSGDELVILESTSPPCATDRLADVILEERPDLAEKGTLQFAHAPERVLLGQVMRELVTNDRIIGGSSPVAAE